MDNYFDNKLILVTGGNGFIGSNLVKYLIKNNKNIKIDIFDKDFNKEVFSGLELQSINFIPGKLEYIKSGEFCKKYHHIFHQGAITDTTVMDEDFMLKVNTESLHQLVELAIKNNATLVYASSAATYGNSEAPNIVGKGETPTNVYGESKLKMDKVAYEYMKKYPELKIIGLRYFNVYGPGESRKGKMSSMILQLYHQIKDKKNPRIFKYGEQKRDFVYVKDVVQANIKAAIYGESGVYNVGFGEARTFNDIVEILKKILKSEKETEYFDNPYSFYQNLTQADISNTKLKLKYNPEFTLEKGIRDYFI